MSSLKEYQAKRDFASTREPAGKLHQRTAPRPLQFVIQKHAARRLHYDLRLEMEGVLKSWAVPKGFPTRRGDRRLAIQVEDHPLEYGGFEGTIPEGNYGAGTVMVWDQGTYQVYGDPLEGLKKGKLHFVFKGKKLKGEWTLVRMRSRGNEDKPQWLLLKSGEDIPMLSARAEDRSALSGRTMDEIATRNERQWQSNRTSSDDHGGAVSVRRAAASALRAPRKSTANGHTKGSRRLDLESELRGLPRARPGFVDPMKALLRKELPTGPEWIYEIKFDGVRALAIKGKKVELVSRAAKDLTGKYPELANTLEKLPAAEAVLDGEIVAVDDQGRPSFQLLQAYQSAVGKKPPLLYYVFDILDLEGRDVTGLPLRQRKRLAEKLVSGLGPSIRFSASLEGSPRQLMGALEDRGLEGLVAKNAESRYEAGRRSGAWVKFKWAHEQEFVIGGYTQPQGARPYFGAILVGYYERDKLLFAGKVGTGFNTKSLKALYEKFRKWVREKCPFDNLPEKRSQSGGLTASEMRKCTWLEPRLVCQVRFSEWTRDDHLRQPVFLGLRDDKRPREVVREEPK